MVANRIIAGTTLAAAIAVAAAVAPAIGAEDARTLVPRRAATVPTSDIGSFTPASADPRLAAVLARAGTTGSGFRFTPSSAGRGGRALSVAVRARTTRGANVAGESAAQPAAVALAPIAYNLGVAVSWKRFALSGDLAKVDLAGQPGSRESADVGVSYTGKAFSGRVKAEAARPLANQPRLVAEEPSYSVDVGGAYSIARNLDLTAGVRYKSERERLPQLTDNRRDSQSVYVGTAFRF
ncbi:hypothetical protein M9980_12180 [Sphingomonas donggukensis]|uniref:Porin domain-containing protein n=1 Tax=Sphingomonas donggukensis TaxID=2949093 RepID=A0ABY4TVU3_9SPHN|nr:hypothetical protein [Sphingomonas donggukensis]URW75289.1 hypothetical protein M9980_12180 [Sphingomonas donggukensis]